jgi:hypothetical protein
LVTGQVRSYQRRPEDDQDQTKPQTNERKSGRSRSPHVMVIGGIPGRLKSE